MSETQLQIVLSLIDNASAQLQEAQGAFAELGTSANSAAAQITNSLTGAEEAVAAQAQAMANSWAGTGADIGASFEEAVPTVELALEDLAAVNLSAAQQVAAQWQAEGTAMEDSLAAAMAEIETTMVSDATAAGEAAGTAAGTGFAGYFKKMIIGYALEQIGSFLSGGIKSAVAAASKGQEQVAALTAQIQQQQASISENEAALQKWTGTTVEVNAAHEKAAANIDAEKVKIQELQQQLAPLMQQQAGLPGQMESIGNSILEWIGGNKQLEDSIQTFTTTLGPMLQGLGVAFIALTLFKVALSVLDAPMLILIGIGVAIAVLTTTWRTFHTQITAFLDDLNAKTGIIDVFKTAWESISSTFEDNLLPALEQLWTALQPLDPYLKAFGVIIGATLVAAIELLVETLTIAVDLFTDLLTIGTKVATFFTNVLVVALNAVETAIQAIITAVNKVGSVGGAIGGAVSTALSAVHLASGGIVSQPTFALIGEAGPEAVIPLSAFAGGTSLAGAGGLGGGSGNIIVNINGGNYLDQSGANQIATALATQIGRQLKLKNFF